MTAPMTPAVGGRRTDSHSRWRNGQSRGSADPGASTVDRTSASCRRRSSICSPPRRGRHAQRAVRRPRSARDPQGDRRNAAGSARRARMSFERPARCPAAHAPWIAPAPIGPPSGLIGHLPKVRFTQTHSEYPEITELDSLESESLIGEAIRIGRGSAQAHSPGRWVTLTIGCVAGIWVIDQFAFGVHISRVGRRVSSRRARDWCGGSNNLRGPEW